MTAEEIVRNADILRPNIISEQTKLNWVNVIEKQIREHMTRFNETKLTESVDTLALEDEYRDMYIYYVISMIDLTNLDIVMYNNSTAFFNEMFTAWQKKWRRENLPNSRGGDV